MANAGQLSAETNVISTALIDTIELASLKNSFESADDLSASGSMTLQSAFQMAGVPISDGLSTAPPPPPTIKLQQAIQDLFENATISLMSSPLSQSLALCCTPCRSSVANVCYSQAQQLLALCAFCRQCILAGLS